ncbi:MAG: NTP transferase domain-containing protein [Ruminococcus sp.]
MKKTALVIMAAGVGSRFGNGIKQLAPVGPNGEIIMDYSIRDALEAGFNKIVFIIRKDLEEEFKSTIGARVEDRRSCVCISGNGETSGRLCETGRQNQTMGNRSCCYLCKRVPYRAICSYQCR